MAFIETLIRRKKLTRAQHVVQLNAALVARGESSQESGVARRQYADISRYLWAQFDASEPLTVQVLAAARHEEARARERLSACDEIHRRECRNVARLELLIARLDKNLEKLEARKTELQRLEALEREAAEAARLEEWVLGRRGAGGSL
jgi:hypothetical protein